MRSFFQATLISPIFLSHSHPLHNTATDPSSAGNPFVGLNAGERASEGDREDRHEEEDDRFAYNLHAMCLVCLAFAFAGFFAHTRDGWRTWLMMRYRMYRGRVESSQEEAMTTFGSGIYWHCLCQCAGIFLIHPEDELVSYVCSHADYSVFHHHCIGGWQDSGNSEVHTHQQLYGRIILIRAFKDHYRQMNKRYILLYILHRAAKLISNFLTGQHPNERRRRRSRPGDLLPHCRSLVNNNLLQTVTLIKFKEESDLLLICLHMA